MRRAFLAAQFGLFRRRSRFRTSRFRHLSIRVFSSRTQIEMDVWINEEKAHKKEGEQAASSVEQMTGERRKYPGTLTTTVRAAADGSAYVRVWR